MKERGVLYIAWGAAAKQETARSIESLQRAGLDYCVREIDGSSNCSAQAKASAKASMLELSPFRETLYLDSDTIVLDDLDFGFEMAARHGLALSIAPACWSSAAQEIVPYDLGVVFFTKTPETRRLFDCWHAVAGKSFSQTVCDTAFNPFVLPENWNFRAKPITCGPIKIWHSRQPPPGNIEDWNRGPICLGSIQHGQVTQAPWYPSTFRAAYPRAV